LQDVTKIPWVTSGSGLQGSFTLKDGDSTGKWAPANEGFNGNVSIDSPPLNCPPPAYPDGINLFEFIVNNGFQTGNPKETVDISCVDGANAYFEGTLVGGGKWDAGPTEPDVKSLYNKAIYSNTGLVGVYPFKCDICTGSDNPPDCGDGKKPAKPQANDICNIQRTPTDDDSSILIDFKGFI
jgi:hypothetical protein